MSDSRTQESQGRQASLEAYRARLGRALAYVQDNLGGELSLDAAAERACFSKYHFHRIFSAAMGESFADYVRRLRLERAANLLEQHPGRTVTEVAFDSGFSSSSLLSRLFAEHFGSPPSRWREERRASARAQSRARAPERRTETSPSLWACLDSPRAGDGSLQKGSKLSLKAYPALRFASCLHIGPYGEEIAEAWARLYRWAGPRGLLGPNALMAGISWDNPELCPGDRCRYSACIGMPEALETGSDMLLLSFPARSYLCLHFAGPESDFAEAYSSLYKSYLPASGFEPEDDPAIEFQRHPPSPQGGFDLEIALPVARIVMPPARG